jgi:hypothetical protein
MHLLKPRLPLTADKGWDTEQFREDRAVQQVLARSIRNAGGQSDHDYNDSTVSNEVTTICDENGGDVVSSCEIPPQSGCGDPWLKIDENWLSILEPLFYTRIYSVVLVKYRPSTRPRLPFSTLLPCEHLCRCSNKLG